MSANVLGPLIAQMRAAFEADGGGLRAPEVSADLLGLMRAAIENDRRSVAADDVKLAAIVRELLPRVTKKASEIHNQLRSQLVSDAPWALVPLDSSLDLLSPLGKALHEPTHTQILAFLMDPGKPHGLGIRVLREVFKMMGRLIPGEDSFERLAFDSAQSTDTLRRIRVTAEHVNELDGCNARCDLWLELEDDHRSLIVVIENKVGASEHGDQLKTYEEALWRRAKERRRLSLEAKLVYLTPDGRLPDQDFDRRLWLPVSYTNLAACLAHASRDAPDPGKTLLNLYNSTILRYVLGVPSHPDGIERMQQLSFLNELQNQGVTS
jgi:hypothetical protein